LGEKEEEKGLKEKTEKLTTKGTEKGSRGGHEAKRPERCPQKPLKNRGGGGFRPDTWGRKNLGVGGAQELGRRLEKTSGWGGGERTRKWGGVFRRRGVEEKGKSSGKKKKTQKGKKKKRRLGGEKTLGWKNGKSKKKDPRRSHLEKLFHFERSYMLKGTRKRKRTLKEKNGPKKPKGGGGGSKGEHWVP